MPNFTKGNGSRKTIEYGQLGETRITAARITNMVKITSCDSKRRQICVGWMPWGCHYVRRQRSL